MSEDVGVEYTLVIVVESSELRPILASTLFVDNGDAVADELPRVTGYEDSTIIFIRTSVNILHQESCDLPSSALKEVILYDGGEDG